MRRIAIALVCTLAVSAMAWGQLVTENFDYTASSALIGQGGWTITGTSTVNAITVGNSGLTYTGYLGSGIGNSIPLANNGQDIYLGFTSQSSGSVYASLLVNVSAAQSGGDYFFHLGQALATTSAFYARLYVRLAANSNLTFGIAKSSAVAGSPAYSDSIYSTGTTYLIVVKYTFNTGTTTDDAVSLFVLSDPSLPSSEPGTPTVGPLTTTQTDATALVEINLRQGNSTLAATVTVDGIRVGTAWNEAPLPVELTSFNASANRLSPQLVWSTATEHENAGWEIERKQIGNRQSAISNWGAVGFVAGAGNSNAPREYSFADANLTPGKYAYRLKQIDNAGTFSYSQAAELELSGAPKAFTLNDAYPNPFNPSTNIRFTLKDAGFTTLKVFNLLGQEVATLFRGEAEAGTLYQYRFDAKGLTSGVYFSVLESGGQRLMKRLLLVK